MNLMKSEKSSLTSAIEGTCVCCVLQLKYYNQEVQIAQCKVGVVGDFHGRSTNILL